MSIRKQVSILAMALTFVLSGCAQKTDTDSYKKAQEMLMNMESYITEATVCYISNKSENTYETKQWVQSNGRYKIEALAPEEIAGNTIINDSKLIMQYKPDIENKISFSISDKAQRSEILLFSFLKNYLNSQDVAVETVSSDDDTLYTVLESQISGDNKFFNTEKLFISTKTNLPEKLIIYDTDSIERIRVIFNTFEYNPQIDTEIFSPQINS